MAAHCGSRCRLLGRDFPTDELAIPGERRHLMLDVPGFPPIEALLMGITWEFADGRTAAYTFAIGVSLEPYNDRRATFRNYLIGWFLGVTLTMLLVVSGLLTFVLRPVHRLERQVREVEAGDRVKSDRQLSVGARGARRQSEHADRYRTAPARALPEHAR